MVHVRRRRLSDVARRDRAAATGLARLPGEADPRDIGIYRTWPVEFAPQVKQHELMFEEVTAAAHYAEHEGKGFYDELIVFITSFP